MKSREPRSSGQHRHAEPQPQRRGHRRHRRYGARGGPGQRGGPGAGPGGAGRALRFRPAPEPRRGAVVPLRGALPWPGAARKCAGCGVAPGGGVGCPRWVQGSGTAPPCLPPPAGASSGVERRSPQPSVCFHSRAGAGLKGGHSGAVSPAGQPAGPEGWKIAEAVPGVPVSCPVSHRSGWVLGWARVSAPAVLTFALRAQHGAVRSQRDLRAAGRVGTGFVLNTGWDGFSGSWRCLGG